MVRLESQSTEVRVMNTFSYNEQLHQKIPPNCFITILCIFATEQGQFQMINQFTINLQISYVFNEHNELHSFFPLPSIY